MIHCSLNVLSQVGPLRCWPGGLCLSKSIVEMDVGEYICSDSTCKASESGWELQNAHSLQFIFFLRFFYRIVKVTLSPWYSRLSNVGGRLIMASDSIRDALSNEAAAVSCRGLRAELAAKLVVKETLLVMDSRSKAPSGAIKAYFCTFLSTIALFEFGFQG
jgi:hypothetical protein